MWMTPELKGAIDSCLTENFEKCGNEKSTLNSDVRQVVLADERVRMTAHRPCCPSVCFPCVL